MVQFHDPRLLDKNEDRDREEEEEAEEEQEEKQKCGGGEIIKIRDNYALRQNRLFPKT